jgi:hypothetical protein
VINEEDGFVEEVRLANADLEEVAQKYEWSEAALEALNNHSLFTTS